MKDTKQKAISTILYIIMLIIGVVVSILAFVGGLGVEQVKRDYGYSSLSDIIILIIASTVGLFLMTFAWKKLHNK